MKSSASWLAARILASVASLMLILSLVSCADGNVTPDDTTSAAPSALTDAPAETSSLFEEDDLGTMELGATVGVLAWADVERMEFNDEIGSETMTSDLIANKLNSRIATVEQRLGIKIEFTAVKGNADNIKNWNSYVETAISGGDHSFEVIAGYSQSVAQNASAGFLYNMHSSECGALNFDKPWWSKRLVDEVTVKGKMFFASGDISRNTLEYMYVCYANTELLDTYNLENPQNFVSTGEWTYAKFFDMCTGLYRDLDGGGTKNCTANSGDQFGYVTVSLHLDPWFYGTGASVCDTDDDGNLIVSESFTGERVANTVSMLCNYLYNTDDCIFVSSNSVPRSAFGEGRSLFLIDRACVSHVILKADYDVDYVVLPVPKYDADQEDYVTVMGHPFTLYGIRNDALDPEVAAIFIECMASEGYRQITPAVFEIQLKTRYVDDPVSSTMYDIIRENLTFEIGRICQRSLGTNQVTFRNAVANNSNYLSSAKTMKRSIERLLPAFMEVFEK